MKFLKFFIILLILQFFSLKLYAENNVAFIDMQLIMDKKNLYSFKKKEESLKKKKQMY